MEKNKLYIGIDPSINSTGITCLYGEEKYFYIIKPDRLTKYENSIDLPYFKYVLYNKYDISDEINKTKNIMNITAAILSVINNISLLHHVDKKDIYICIEGVAMGAVHTNCLVELAALNHIIRENLIINHIDNIIIAPPSVIKKFACGAGNARKTVITNIFTTAFPDMKTVKKCDDIADSYFMALYICRKTRVEAV